MKKNEEKEHDVEKMRDTYRYVLRRGKEVVYYGITKSNNKSEVEKENSNKNFIKISIFPTPVNKKVAEEWQKVCIKSYFQRTKGKIPEYNKN